MTEPSRPVRRIVVAATAAAVVVAGAVTTATAGDRGGDLVSDYDRSVRQATEAVAAVKAEAAHSTAEPHTHNDPSTKNALSRAGESTEDAQDPTSAAEKIANAAAVAAGRGTPEPALTTTPANRPRAVHPATRYAMANGCYSLVADGEPLYFKPTRLGDYLLYDAERQFVTSGAETAAQKSAEPSNDTSSARLRSRPLSQATIICRSARVVITSREQCSTKDSHKMMRVPRLAARRTLPSSRTQVASSQSCRMFFSM